MTATFKTTATLAIAVLATAALFTPSMAASRNLLQDGSLFNPATWASFYQQAIPVR